MVYLLYNPLANNNTGEQKKEEVIKVLEPKYGKMTTLDVTKMNYDEFLNELKEDDRVVLLGGDGTLMKFANTVYGKKLVCPFFLYKAGTGNDFLTDVASEVENDMVELNKFVEDLPTIYVNDQEYRFINGIGYGIDGFVCEIAEKQKAAGKKKISYAGLSIKNLIHGYKCPKGKVTVDGVTKEYKKVWLASTMNGRFYGGGMMVAPEQDRLGDYVTNVVFHDSGKFKTLITFPKLFKGTHVQKKKIIEVRSGHDVTVEFDRPMALQIDGEVIYNVTKYRVVKK